MMNRKTIIASFGLAALVFLLSIPVALAQKHTGQWLRVITEEEFFVDIDRSSLILERNGIISSKFRTTLVSLEPVPGKSAIKYQTRLDSIEFKPGSRQYRILESTFIDRIGSVVSSFYERSAEGWKAMEGRTGSRLLRAASQLSPFGTWKVLTYRYASGELPASDDPTELTSLIRTDVRFSLDKVQVGKASCSAPIFEPKTIASDDFVNRTGKPFSSLGISTNKVEVIVLKCQARDQFPSQTLILFLSGEKAMMLWEGVFLEIQRPENLFLP